MSGMVTTPTTARGGRAALVATAASALMFTVACGGTRGSSGVPAQAAAGESTPMAVSCEPHQRALVRPTIVNGAAVSQVECVASEPLAQYPGAPAVQVESFTQPATVYAPQPAVYTPRPAYAPQPAPVYAPQPAPVYAPQPAPVYAPQPAPVYAPQPAPVYAPQPAPVYAPPAATTARRAPQPIDDDDFGDARVEPVSGGSARPVAARQIIYDERPVRKTRSVKKSAIIIGSSAGAGAGLGAAIGGKKGSLIGAAIGGGGAAIWDQVTRRK